MAFSEQDKVIEDILLSLSADDFNNVTFHLSDGKTEANKTILSIRSEYFKTMFQSQFREKASDVIEMPQQKVVFDKVILFLYTGNLEFSSLSLAEVLQLENVLNLMMLESAVEATRDYITQSSLQGGFSPAEVTKSVDLTYEFALETSKQSLLHFLNENLRETAQLAEFVQLPSKIVKDLLMATAGGLPYHRLSALVCWLQEEGNHLEAEDLQTLRDTFPLQHFSTQEILGLVRKSNIFPPELIMEALSNIIKAKDESLAVMAARVNSLQQESQRFDTLVTCRRYGGEILSKLNTDPDFWFGFGLDSQDILIRLDGPRRVNKVRFSLRTRKDLIIGYKIFHLTQQYNADDEIVELSRCLVNHSDMDAKGAQRVYFSGLIASNIVIRLNIKKRPGFEDDLQDLWDSEAGNLVFTDDSFIHLGLCTFCEIVRCQT